MDDKDHVFARFRDDKPVPGDRRETLTIPRRGGATGSRVVEVVHVRSGGAPTTAGQARRPTSTDRAATWEKGFPARPPAGLPGDAAPAGREAAKPTTHVMPAWRPTAVHPAADMPVRADPPAVSAVAALGAGARRPSRRVADPFDAGDEGANCMRCGYAIEPAREKRGLMTCSACG
ncbi:hypothetical protein [Roseomonas sp. HF4]|uniref:hypothetical protein n=1 Tax=Roseomonas sp. HF4 TaxID=2562313 RepID=UPI0010C0B408|nr:hypothetical protein [Roseomonas sp. HF4]